MPGSPRRRALAGLLIAALATVVTPVDPAGADHCLVSTVCRHKATPTNDEPTSRQTAPADSDTARLEPAAADQLLRLVNDDRARYGLAPLRRRADLDGWARRHSLRMAAAEQIWHNDAWFTDETKRSVGADRVSENVAAAPDVATAHRRLMASPGHRANLLDGRFTLVGMAVASDEDGFLYLTESFVTPLGSGGAASTTPVVVPPLRSSSIDDGTGTTVSAGRLPLLHVHPVDPPTPATAAPVRIDAADQSGRPLVPTRHEVREWLLWLSVALVLFGALVAIRIARPAES